MLRVSTFLLCLLLAAASAGRYRAEVAVRETRQSIGDLERTKAEEERRIQVLRAELAFLENPERLAKIAREKTELEPLTGHQLLSPKEFLTAMGADDIIDRSSAISLKTAAAKSKLIESGLTSRD